MREIQQEPKGFYLGPGFGNPTPEEEKDAQEFFKRVGLKNKDEQTPLKETAVAK